MAPKKKGSTALARRPTNTALADWQQEIAEEAKADAAKFQQGLARISTIGGKIQIDGKPVEGNKLVVVIVAAVFGKAYYEGDFDPDAKATPVCYAFSNQGEPKEAPHEAAPDKQNSTCLGCPHNKFGTAERGNGKRCKDEIRLMCAVRTDDLEALTSGEFRTLSVPPGSIKNWGKYVALLRDNGLTFRACWTEISVEPLKGAYQLVFKSVEPLESADMYQAVKAKRESAEGEMMQPYPVLDSGEETVKDKKKAARRAAKMR